MNSFKKDAENLSALMRAETVTDRETATATWSRMLRFFDKSHGSVQRRECAEIIKANSLPNTFQELWLNARLNFKNKRSPIRKFCCELLFKLAGIAFQISTRLVLNN